MAFIALIISIVLILLIILMTITFHLTLSHMLLSFLSFPGCVFILNVPPEEPEQSSLPGNVPIQETALRGEEGVGYDQREVQRDGVTGQHHSKGVVAGNLLLV